MKANDIEGWIEYVVGMSAILLRIFARYRHVGIKKWQGDDYLTFVSLVTFNVQMVIHDQLGMYSKYLGIIMQHDVDKVTDAVLIEANMNSKWTLASWYVYATLLWSLKGCVVFFYLRLTTGLRRERYIKGCGYLAIVTYIAIMIMISVVCTPLAITWDTIKNNEPVFCHYSMPELYVIGTSNILLDILLLCAIFPIVKKAQLSWKRKLAIGFLICGGIFTIIASVLNNVMTLLVIADSIYGTFGGRYKKLGPGFLSWILQWGSREMVTAILVVNIPCIKPLFSTKNWLRGSSNGSGDNTPRVRGPALVKELFARRKDTRDSEMSLVELPYRGETRYYKQSTQQSTQQSTLYSMDTSTKKDCIEHSITHTPTLDSDLEKQDFNRQGH